MPTGSPRPEIASRGCGEPISFPARPIGKATHPEPAGTFPCLTERPVFPFPAVCAVVTPISERLFPFVDMLARR
jgi:hypothetical protein